MNGIIRLGWRLIRWILAIQPRKEAAMCEQPFNPQELLEAIKGYLAEMEWTYGEDTSRQRLHMGYGGSHAVYHCLLQVHPERPLVAFYSHVQCRVPPNRRAAVAEFVARANMGLLLGNFEFDLDAGEVRYKTSLDVVDGLLTGPMLGTLMQANLSTIDRYLPGLMSVLWNDVAPEDAIGLAEAA